MKLIVCENADKLGELAAERAAALISEAIKERGQARILLSTGASQFTFFEHFTKCDVDWSKVEMFHLDEYVGIPKTHPASFNFYLTNRFVNKVHPGKYHLIDGTADPAETIKQLTEELDKSPIDVGLIGIGENAHIAFNDPPADFEDSRAYKVVTLADRCLQQQIGEGWFKNKEECYKQAISMTCKKIMECRHIISAVPYKVKAEAVYKTLTEPSVTPDVPATLLRTHEDVYLYADKDSASLLDGDTVKKFS